MQRYSQIIVYGYSTCLPRPDSSNSSETWPSVVHKQIGIETPIYIRGFAGADSHELKRVSTRDLFHFGLDSKDNQLERSLVILMFGIVDCAVLPFTYKLARVKQIPVLGNYVWKYFLRSVHPFRPKLQTFWSHNAVAKDKFKSNLEQILLSLSPEKTDVLLVLHPIPHKNTEERSPKWRESAIQYNEIKSKLATVQPNIYLVDTSSFPPELFISPQDGHHFSKLGHSWIAHKIMETYFHIVPQGFASGDFGINES